MSDATFAPTYGPVAIPVRELLPWAIFAGLMLMLAIWAPAPMGRVRRRNSPGRTGRW